MSKFKDKLSKWQKIALIQKEFILQKKAGGEVNPEYIPETLNKLLTVLSFPGTPISGLTAATTPLGGTEPFPLVQGGVTKKAAVNAAIQLAFRQLGYVRIGNGAQYDFLTMQSAVSAGHHDLWVCTDITETLSANFTGFLNIVVSGGVTITFDDATPFVVPPGENGSIAFNAMGFSALTYSFTSDQPLIDMSQSGPAIPVTFSGGAFFVQNSSLPARNTPFILGNLGILQLIDMQCPMICILNGNANPLIDADALQAKMLVGVGSGSTPESLLRTASGGHIQDIYLENDMNASSVVIDVTNTQVENIHSMLSTSGSSFNFVDSNLSGFYSEGTAIHLIKATSNSEQCIFSGLNGVDFVPLTSATNQNFIAVSDSDLFSLTGTGFTDGVINFVDSQIQNQPVILESNANYRFISTQFLEGAYMAVKNSAFGFCTFGDPQNNLGTRLLEFDAAAQNNIVYACFGESALLDGGTNNDVMSYKVMV